MSYLNICPPGVVLPYAGSTAPDGWLLCDGTAYSQTTYAALYSVLSTTYNTQTDPTTGAAWAAPAGGNFRVPDYRGSFLRGVGTASGKDATTLGGYQAEKTAKNGLGVSSSSTDLSHTHNAPTGSFATNNFPSAGQGYVWSGASTGGTFSINNQATTTGASITMSHTHTQTVTGDNETRPLNKGVNYIIKI